MCVPNWLIDCYQGVGTLLIGTVLMQGMILLSELSRRRIRSINKLIRVGRTEPVVVIRLVITVLNIWWPMPLFLIYYYSQIGTVPYWDEYILHTVILLGGCMVVWTWSGLEACLFWSCIDVIVVRVKVSRGIEPFSPMGIDSADTSQPPNGAVLWNRNYFLRFRFRFRFRLLKNCGTDSGSCSNPWQVTTLVPVPAPWVSKP